MLEKNQIKYWLLFCIPLLYTTNTLDPGISIRFVAIALYCFIGILLFKKKQISYFRNQLVFFIIYFLFIIFQLIALFHSPLFYDGLAVFVKYLLMFSLTFCITFINNNQPDKASISKSIVFIGLIITIAALFQLFITLRSGILLIPDSTYDVTVFFGHRNLISEMMFFTLPFSIFLFKTEEGRWKNISIIVFSIELFTLIILSNRTTWIALLAAFILYVIFYLIKGKILWPKIKKASYSIFLISGIILLFTIIFYKSFTNTDSLRDHVKNIISTNSGTTGDRIGLWKKSLMCIKEKPIWGHGLASWKIEILKKGSAGLKSENNISFYQRPHNDFIWLFSESGVFGLIMYISLIVYILYLNLRIIIKNPDYKEYNFYLSVLSGFAGYLIFACFSFPLERIEHGIFLSFFIAGTLIFYQNNKVSYKIKFNPLIKYLMLILVFLMVVFGILRWENEVYARKAVDAKIMKNYSQCIKEVNKVNLKLYPFDIYSTPLLWYKGLSESQLNQTTDAFNDFESALKQNPYHIYVIANLATCYELQGNHDKAIGLYKKAIALAPYFNEAGLDLCAAYYNCNMIDSAGYYMMRMSRDTSTRYKLVLCVVLFSYISRTAIQAKNDEFNKMLSQHKNDPDFFEKIKKEVKLHSISIREFIDEKMYLRY
jgi:O-antigen ligase